MRILQILWLDDLRDPNDYLYRKEPKVPSAAFTRNRGFYDKLKGRYELKFTWVKNIEEFKNYILTNGLPDLVSFDHDLGRGLSKGSECAQWLFSYCKENGLQMPKWFAHSANSNGRAAIESILSENRCRKIYLNEKQFKNYIKYLSETVYINSLNNKNKKANITYQQGVNRSVGNQNYFDKLKTDKMDNVGSNDTYEVPLKGGMMSYNITSIQGEDIMHYFKNYFNHKKSYSKIDGEDYELSMESREFNQFLDTFIKKVSSVVRYYISKLPKGSEFSGISIYPVKSSSNFNIEMCNEIADKAICGLPITPISTELFQKNLENLERDDEFIKKNKEYYDGKLSNCMDGTVNQYLDRDINQSRAIQKIREYIVSINKECNILLSCINNYKGRGGKVGDSAIRNIVVHYRMYSDLIDEMKKTCTYFDTVRGIESSFNEGSIFKKLKYSKGPSIEGRSDFLWNLVKPFLWSVKSPITKKPYKKIDLVYIEKVPFEIKTLSNGERMGLRNIYSLNKDINFAKEELNKISGTIFIIFDDNISGGATLSDVCYNAQKAGIKNILPITFGKMNEKWTMGTMPLNLPINNNGEIKKFNYS